MTLPELEALAESLPLPDLQRAMVRFTTIYHTRLAADRKARSERRLPQCPGGCEDELVSSYGRGRTIFRCVVCGREREYDSSD